MAAIDTSVLVRLLVQDDPEQTEKAEVYLQANAPLWLSLSVLVETFYVLMRLYGWKKPALLAMLQSTSNSRHFTYQDQAAVVAGSSEWAKAKAGFVDCLNVELARVHGKVPLATFDKDLMRIPGSIGL